MSAPHQNGSFSYKTINKKIKEVLDNRAELNNTIQVAQPFIKVTSTVRVPDVLGPGRKGFTLGLHAIPEDVQVENIYADKKGNSLIGYTYNEKGQTERVYAQVNANSELAGKFFYADKVLLKTTDVAHIPPPGITSLTVGKNRNGLISYADVSFVVPTLPQLELLNRTFLIPSVGMVVEWGQNYAQTEKNIFGQSGIWEKTIRENMFPWYDNQKLTEMLDRLGKNQVSVDEILQKYVIPTQGQYCWMFGRVTNFVTRNNADGSFECTVKIVGPSENSWAYSTRNTVVPQTNRSGQVCAEDVNSIESYFSTTSPGINFKTLIEKTYNGSDNDLKIWQSHVKKFTKENKIDGEKNSQPNASEMQFGDSEDSFFITWRFFVNVVLNSEEYGLKKIFADAKLTDDEVKNISLLRPYSEDGKSFNITTPDIDDPYENWVGNNKHLRSIDPGTMIIVNDEAVKVARADLTLNRPGLVDELTNTELANEFARQGDFYWSASKVPEALSADGNDKGLLSTGVWVNHKAVVQSMIASDTALGGISNLLQRMSAATMNYWQLSIDVSEPIFGEPETAENYAVVDVNFRESSDYAVAKFRDNVHIFNKFARKNSANTLLGSDVLECNVDLNLPKRLFSQIATLGLVQKQDFDSDSGTAPMLNNANETLRKMFAITSISDKDSEGLGPDLTKPAKDRDTEDTCGGVSGQSVAQSAGSGNQVTKPNSSDVFRSTEETEVLIAKVEEQLRSEKCTGVCLGDVSKTTLPSTTDVATTNIKDSFIYTGTKGQQVRVIVAKDVMGAPMSTIRKLYDNNYRNGRIPENKLTRINQGNHRMYRDAAEKFIAMSEAAASDGISLSVTDSYRSIRQQILLTEQKGLVSDSAPLGTPENTPRYDKGLTARPGTSNHGWGLAVDINTQPGGYDGVVYGWLKKNARKFGFKDTVSKEPWHWEYTGPISSDIEKIPLEPTPEIVVPVIPAVSSTTPGCEDCVKAKSLLLQLQSELRNSSKYDRGRERLVREFPTLNNIFAYVEPYPDLMVARMAGDANGNRSNAFGASPGALSINANITIPGIAGLRIGELFWLDRIPTYYKAFGAFQTLSIEDVINTDGWQTKINAKFNYLGEKWKASVAVLLTETLQSTPKTTDSDR